MSLGCPCLAMLHLPGMWQGFAWPLSLLPALCQVLSVVSPVSPATSCCLGAGQSVLTVLSGPKAADVWGNDSSMIQSISRILQHAHQFSAGFAPLALYVVLFADGSVSRRRGGLMKGKS